MQGRAKPIEERSGTEEFRAAVVEGLSQQQKTIPPKFLYDDLGSLLFEEICDLEEYYPTRTETGILKKYAKEMAGALGPNAVIIEPGAGSCQKIRILLPELNEPRAYVPVEVSQKVLFQAAEEIRKEFPDLHVLPVWADYEEYFRSPKNVSWIGGRTSVFFPGSTIGNLDPKAARAFLESVGVLVGEGGGLLIGLDRKKDSEILRRAYNDKEGVTAEFNVNLLRRINRELGANFVLPRYHHEAVYNETLGRIEMHLVSDTTQIVQVSGETFRFREGETIHTESSYKYSKEEFQDLALSAGFETKNVWSDDQELFSVYFLQRLPGALTDPNTK